MYILGDVEKVTAWIDETPVVPGVFNDAPAVIMWKHKDKKLYGVWDITSSDEMYIESKYYTCDERLEITGSRGVLWVTRCTACMLPEVAPVVMYRDGKLTKFWDIKHDWADSFEASTRDFVEAIKLGREPVLSGERGREVMKFALAAIDSSNRKSEVYLDSYEDKPLPKKHGFIGNALFGRK
jgi:predicted dehydrogenase